MPLVKVARFIGRNQHNLLPPAVGAAGGAAVAERRDASPKREAAGIAAGAAGYGGFKAYGMHVKAQGDKVQNTPPEGMSNSKRKSIRDNHYKAHGLHPNQPDIRQQLERRPEVYRTWPKELRDAPFKRKLGHMSGTKGKLMEAAAIGVPTALVAGRKDKVHKGAGKFALVGTLTGTGGVGTGLAVRGQDHDLSNQLIGSTAGGWGGQGIYQGAGYAAKHRVLREQRKMTRNQTDKLLKPAKQAHGAFTPAMYRNFPSTLPGWKTNRVLGWTHRGKTGTVIGGMATLAGTGLAVSLVRPKEQDMIHKGFGYERKRVSPVRATEAAAGITLLGWGGSRLGLTKTALAMGSRKAGNAGIRYRRAEKARQAVETTTGRGSAMLGAALNTGARIRPIEATVAGGVLLNDAIPIRRKKFTPVNVRTQQGGY